MEMSIYAPTSPVICNSKICLWKQIWRMNHFREWFLAVNPMDFRSENNHLGCRWLRFVSFPAKETPWQKMTAKGSNHKNHHQDNLRLWFFSFSFLSFLTPFEIPVSFSFVFAFSNDSRLLKIYTNFFIFIQWRLRLNLFWLRCYWKVYFCDVGGQMGLFIAWKF